MKSRVTSRTSGLLALLLAALVSCGGSGGSGEPAGGGGGGGPATSVSVVFPPPGAINIDSQASICGTTTLGAEAVEVAGVAASSDDGFLTWRVDLTLEEGTNELDVRVTEAGVSFPVGTHQLSYEPRLDVASNSVALGADGSAVYFARGATGGYALTRVDIDGSRQTFQNLTLLTAPGSNGMAYDSLRQRLTCFASMTTILVFDLANDATLGIISPPNPGGVATTLALDPTSGDVFVNVREINPLPPVEILYSLDPLSGSYVSVSGPWPQISGLGLQFLSYDAINDYLYGWDVHQRRVLRFDPTSGAQIALASNLASLGMVTGMAVNPVQSRIEIVNFAGERYGISTIVGPPVLLSRVAEDPGYANEPPSGVPQLPPYLGIQGDGRGALALMRRNRAIRIDAQGNGSLLYRMGRGLELSLHLGAFNQLTWDSNRDHVVGNGGTDLYSLDPMTGDPMAIPNPGAGFVAPIGKRIYFDAEADRIYYIGGAGSPPVPGIYVTPATGGDSVLEAPLPLGLSTPDIDYDPATDEFLAVTVTFFGPPTSIQVSRIASSGATIATFQIMNSPVLGTEFLADAVSRSIFGLRQPQMDIVRLALPNFALTSIAPFVAPTNTSYVMIHDRQRNELIRYLSGTLTITGIATGQETSSVILPGRYATLFALGGLTRDPKTGMIYLGGPNGRMLVVDPESFTTTVIHD